MKSLADYRRQDARRFTYTHAGASASDIDNDTVGAGVIAGPADRAVGRGRVNHDGGGAREDEGERGRAHLHSADFRD